MDFDPTGASAVPRRAVGAIASELSAVVRESFDGARTPEGMHWRRLRDARGRPLVRSGRLRTAAVRPVFFGLTLRVFMPRYGAWQNDGTRTIPARAFLPAVPLDVAVERRFVRAAEGVSP
jgi:phage gpG-like protein